MPQSRPSPLPLSLLLLLSALPLAAPACPTENWFTTRDSFVVKGFHGYTEPGLEETFSFNLSTSFNGKHANCTGQRPEGQDSSPWLGCAILDEDDGDDDDDEPSSFRFRRTHVPLPMRASGLGEWFEFEHEFACEDGEQVVSNGGDGGGIGGGSSSSDRARVTGSGCLQMSYYVPGGKEDQSVYETWGVSQNVRVTGSSAAPATEPFDPGLGCVERFEQTPFLEVVGVVYERFPQPPSQGMTHLSFNIINAANGSDVSCIGNPQGNPDGSGINDPSTEWRFTCGVDPIWKQCTDMDNWSTESAPDAMFAYPLTLASYENAPNTLTISQAWNCTAETGEVTMLNATATLELPPEVGGTGAAYPTERFKVPAVLE
ncbi:hypothetical protein F4778DRAFT_322957 [Xylariomycetidae sp. FL2044]|nr:hypothetical protein F4778DRAFT_322957 [Xylariomycetidae sp. FL2044]